MSQPTSGKHPSLWLHKSPVFSSAPLDRDLHVDVCVIGAGIAGLTTAHNLLQDGLTVAVLEDGAIGGGETGRTSAHLSNALDDRYHNLERWHGHEGARRAAESHAYAIDEIERISRDHKIACDFRRVRGYLFRDSDENIDELSQEFDAARRAGLTVSWTDRAPFTNFDTKRCLVFENQAEFNPMRYLHGLGRLVAGGGGQIFTGVHASAVDGGEQPRVSTNQGFSVSARAVVVATNTPFTDRVAIHTKQAAYRSFLIGASVGKDVIPHALYWDTGDPYHYVRVTADPDDENSELLLIGGEDEKTGQTEGGDEPFQALEAWARLRFPSMGAVRWRWSGQVLEPADGLAFIGLDPSGQANVYVVTGDSGNGLTHGVLAGKLLSDLIAGRPNPWATLYDPSRKPVRAAATFVEENLNTAVQYADWATGGDVKDVADIPAGCGAILRRGLKKVAVYKAADGAVREFSAVCPHLGALVRWNDTEKSWDCPAHGSRFTCDGAVVNGPANTALTAVDEDAKTKR